MTDAILKRSVTAKNCASPAISARLTQPLETARRGLHLFDGLFLPLRVGDGPRVGAVPGPAQNLRVDRLAQRPAKTLDLGSQPLIDRAARVAGQAVRLSHGHARRQRPLGQGGNRHRLSTGIQPHAGLPEAVEVAAQPETATGPLEGLGVRRRDGVFAVGPLLAGAGVAAQPRDRHGGRHQHLAGHDRLAPLHAAERRHGRDRVLARPARRREEFVEPVRVGARIGEGQDDAAPAIVEGAHHAPLDQRRIERRFELREELLALGFRKLRCGHTSPPLGWGPALPAT